MEIDVNLRLPITANGLELKTISAGSYGNNNGHNNPQHHHHHHHNNNNNNNSSNHHHNEQLRLYSTSASASSSTAASSSVSPPSGCCGLLSRLLCSSNTRGKTGSSSSDYNTYNNSGNTPMALYGNVNGNGSNGCTPSTNPLALYTPHNPSSYMNLLKKNHTHRRTPQEVYFESRGKSCKKLLKFNGNSNKILLYPEEGWARTAASSYWTITPCWWQPNRCRIEEFAGTQRQVTKAKMVPLEQKGSLLVVGHFRSKNSSSSSFSSSQTAATMTATSTSCSPLASAKDTDEFKLYLSSNISMEDYNMGYCLTGFVERRCQQTNTFQMTHFAVIKRQWPSLAQNNKNSKTNFSSFSCSGGNGTATATDGGNAASKST